MQVSWTSSFEHFFIATWPHLQVTLAAKSSLSSHGTSYVFPTHSSNIYTNLCTAPTLLLALLSQVVCLCPTKALCVPGRFKIIFSQLSQTSMTCAQQGMPSRHSRVSRTRAALGRMDPDRLGVSTHLFPHLDSNFFPSFYTKVWSYFSCQAPDGN